MKRLILAGALALAVPQCVHAGDHCRSRPVRTAVASMVERWKARTAKLGRFACQVAATVRPVVTVGFERSRPVLALTYTVGGGCANGMCPTK